MAKNKQTNTHHMSDTQTNKGMPRVFYVTDDEGAVQKVKAEDYFSALARGTKGLKAIEVEGGATIAKADVVKHFAKIWLLSDEPTVPEGAEDLQNQFDAIGEKIAEHKKLAAKAKDTDAEEKRAKADAKEQAKIAKEAEIKEVTSNGDFLVGQMEKTLDKAEQLAEKRYAALMDDVSKKLPDSVHFTEGGMGLVFGDDTSKDDLAKVATQLFAMKGATDKMEGKFQLLIGDLLNQFVKNKVFWTQDDAAKALSTSINEKMGKPYAIGSVKSWALCAERVPSDLRKNGVPITLYMKAANFNPPKLKAAQEIDPSIKVSDLESRIVPAFGEKRTQLIEAINSGAISSVKQFDAEVESFRKEKNLFKPKENVRSIVQKAALQYFFAIFIKENLVGLHNNPGETPTARLQMAKGAYVEKTAGQLTDLEEEAKNTLLTLLVPNLPHVIKGSIRQKTDKGEKSIDVLLQNPFEEEEKPKTPDAPAAPEAAPEPTETVVVNLDDDEDDDDDGTVDVGDDDDSDV